MLTGGGDPAGAKALADNLPTAGLAIFDFDVKDWGDVAFRRGKLVLFVSPRLLRTGIETRGRRLDRLIQLVDKTS